MNAPVASWFQFGHPRWRVTSSDVSPLDHVMGSHHIVPLIVLVLVAGCVTHSAKRISRSFPAEGITKVVVRAAEVESATFTNDLPSVVEISGLPSGTARGYHASNPNWRETPAERWGFDFVAKRRGSVLVISSKNEIGYIHHHYVLAELRVRVPPGVEVIRQARRLSGSGEPDLSEQ